MEVRTLITEALNRANVVPRRQPAPGDKMETGLKLLKAVASQYNNDNYLAFTQCSIDLPCRQYIHIYDEVDTMAGEHNMIFATRALLEDYSPTEQDFLDEVYGMAKDSTNTYFRVIKVGDEVQWFEVEHPDEFEQRFQQMKRYCEAYHMRVREVAKLNTLFVNRGGAQYGMYKLNWLPRNEFDGYYSTSLYWTWTEMAEGEWLIELKPFVADNAAKLKLEYNRSLKFDIDTDLRVPDAYNELLTVALTYKMAVKWPRLDEAHMTRLENELATMLDNVSTPKADAKQVLRDVDQVDWSGTPQGVLSGRCLYGF